MLAQKALLGFETETRELLGGTEENSVSRRGVIDLPSRQINDFLQKGKRKKIELVTKLAVNPVYYPEVRENSGPGVEVLRLQAEDGDVPDESDPPTQLTYTILSGNPQSLFSIDSRTGIIQTTRRSLDREAQAEHELEILVHDNGNPPLNSTTRVFVKVLDDNDNRPRFLERYYKVSVPQTLFPQPDAQVQNDQEADLAISSADNITNQEVLSGWDSDHENTSWQLYSPDDFEESERVRYLFRMLVDDTDTIAGSEVEFSLGAGSDSDLQRFLIHPLTGSVYTREDLRSGEKYELLVKASDGRSDQDEKFSLARVSLTIGGGGGGKLNESENAHPPKVLESVITSQVLESDPVGHLVAHVEAEDKDGDDLWYTVVKGDPENEFYISPDKGTLLLAKRLDYETRNFYNLTVRVSDGFGRHADALVVITVLDVNEHRPAVKSSQQVWSLNNIPFIFCKKIIDLPGGQIYDPSSGKHYSLPFLPATPSCPSWTLEGLFKLRRYPSRALDLPRALLPELQRYKDNVKDN